MNPKDAMLKVLSLMENDEVVIRTLETTTGDYDFQVCKSKLKIAIVKETKP